MWTRFLAALGMMSFFTADFPTNTTKYHYFLLIMNILSVEQRLEDIEAIKDLMSRYSFHINKGWNGKEVNPEAIRTIFVEDARWECPALNLSGSSR